MNDTEEQIYDEGYKAGMEAAAKICDRVYETTVWDNCAALIREEIKKL